MNNDFLKVSELNQYIKDVVLAGFPRALWICGEIQGYDRNKDKNHVFFELVEKDAESKNILARIGVVIFSTRKDQIRQTLLKSENAFELKDDIEVKFLCKIDFYAPHGALRLIIEQIDPIHTLGKIAQERQKLIALLQNKGVFEKNKQLTLPEVPLSIGLITSDDSAAYNDFVDELRRSDFGFKIFLRNCLMQGKKAEKDVCKALEELSQLKDLDVIVITRGGGSIAELSCFDSQMIAEKIADCRLPVLTGIGHEINLTITDLAAHTYQKTPTAVAQFLVQRVQNFLNVLEEKWLEIVELVDVRIEEEKRQLKEEVGGLHRVTHKLFQDHNEKLALFRQLLLREPLVRVKEHRKVLLHQQESLSRAARTYLHQVSQKLTHQHKLIEAFNPINTLKRGFSITRASSGRLVRYKKDVTVDENITTELADGLVESKVHKIQKREG